MYHVCKGVQRLSVLIINTTSNRDKGTNVNDRFRVGNKHRARRCENQLTPALAFVKTNYAEKITLDAVARLCGLGRYQFSRTFKQAHGTTFREFVINLPHSEGRTDPESRRSFHHGCCLFGGIQRPFAFCADVSPIRWSSAFRLCSGRKKEANRDAYFARIVLRYRAPRKTIVVRLQNNPRNSLKFA